MSNDWLMTLLSGVGGAFTGATAANERRSREAELARQVARQAMLDERQAKLDAESAFDRGIQRESVLGELGYERGTIPRTGPAMMQLPGMGALDVGAVMDARIGPQMTTPDGGQFTLNRFQTPRAREANAARAVLEARIAAEQKARQEFLAQGWEVNERTGQRVNKRTGEVQPIPGYKPTPQTPNPMAQELSDQRTFQRETALAGDFRQEQEIKDAKGIAGAVATIQGALNNPSPQGDLAAIYALVKLYDPGSVVREGEISLTQSAASLPEQVRRLWSGWNNGKKLTDQMKADMASVARDIVAQRQAQIAPVLQRYGQQARRWGVDSASVAPNPLESTGMLANPVANDVDATLNQLLGRKP